MNRAKAHRKRKDTPNILAPELPELSGAKRCIRLAPPEVRSLAQNLIDDIEEHVWIRQARIVLVMTTGHKADATGRVELGKARRVGPLVKFLAGCSPDFVVELNAGQWAAITPDQQAALMDHELSHCGPVIAGRFVGLAKRAEFLAEIGPRLIEVCEDVRDDKGRCLVRYVRQADDGRPAWKIRHHDVEDFVGVMGRWGGWTDTHVRMIDVLEKADPQLRLIPAGAAG